MFDEVVQVGSHALGGPFRRIVPMRRPSPCDEGELAVQVVDLAWAQILRCDTSWACPTPLATYAGDVLTTLNSASVAGIPCRRSRWR